jgi:integrase
LSQRALIFPRQFSGVALIQHFIWGRLCCFIILKGGIGINKPKAIKLKQADELLGKLFGSDRLLMKLAIKSGLRISDLLNLKVEAIAKTMTVYETKSKRERTFKIGKKLYVELQNHCRGMKNDTYVFQSAVKHGKHIHRSTIHRRIKKALQGLNFDCSAHSFRKRFAQNTFKKLGSVKKVQKAMNHHKISTTAAYLNIDVEKLIKGVKHGKRN